MAISAAPYGKFLMGLGTGQFNFTSDTIKLLLLTASYTPSQNTHEFYSDVITYEVSSSGTNYTAGGQTLTGVTWTYDTTNKRGTLGADSVLWSAASLTTRYGVFYKSTGTTTTSRLISWIDFGTSKTYAAEDISLSFVNGIVRVRAV